MARQFNGTNQALRAASVDFEGINSCSASFWFRCTEYSTATEVVLESSDDYELNNGWAVYTDSDTLIVLATHGAGGYNVANYTGPTPADQWRHYVAIFDKSQTTNEVDLYIDGTLQTASSRPFTANNTETFFIVPVNFASRAATSLWRNCSLAAVAVWNMRLTGGNITSLRGTAGVAGSAALPTSIQAANLKGYWPLVGTASPEPDTSGAGHDAALTGTPGQVTDPIEIQTAGAAETRTITMVRGG